MKLRGLGTVIDLTSAINQASFTYGIDPGLLSALIQQESGGQNLSPNSAGAMGVAQFLPATAADMGIDPMNPTQAVMGAAKYLSQLISQYGGNTSLALAAYNWGMGNLNKNIAANGGTADTESWPTETQNYVTNILAMVGRTFSFTNGTSTSSLDSSENDLSIDSDSYLGPNMEWLVGIGLLLGGIYIVYEVL